MRNRHGKKPPFEDVAATIAGQVPEKVIHQHYDGGHKVEQETVLKLRTHQIAIGLPMDELMFSKFFVNYLGMNIMPWDAVITTQSTYLPDARNQIHNVFLDKGVGSHLLMLDSDVLPPPAFIDTLLAHNLPIVGGWYRKKEKYGYKDANGGIIITQRPVVYDYVGGEKGNLFSQRVTPGHGLEQVGGAGAGAWLMRRDVAEKLGHSPYSMENGGEDLVLCRKITELGIPMYVDWSLACAHMGVFFV